MELLVAVAILSIITVVTFSVMDHTSSLWRRSSANIESFQSARVGFDLITRELSQATLNTYLDYDNPDNPSHYRRRSDLQFVCGPAGVNSLPGTRNTGCAVFFQAPVSYTAQTNLAVLEGSLNTCGFFVSFGADPSIPSFASAKQSYRYRLMNLIVPTENNSIYANINSLDNSFGWFNDHVAQSTFPVAENVIALVIRPEAPDNPMQFGGLEYNSLTKWKEYPQPNSANQLPPILNVSMVAIDERSALRIEKGDTPPAVISGALQNFQSLLQSNPSDISGALDSLGSALTANKINYRVFSSKVPLRESKWTKQ
jgi:uncharacterized protein (TIGR02599 family)